MPGSSLTRPSEPEDLWGAGGRSDQVAEIDCLVRTFMAASDVSDAAWTFLVGRKKIPPGLPDHFGLPLPSI